MPKRVWTGRKARPTAFWPRSRNTTKPKIRSANGSTSRRWKRSCRKWRKSSSMGRPASACCPICRLTGLPRRRLPRQWERTDDQTGCHDCSDCGPVRALPPRGLAPLRRRRHSDRDRRPAREARPNGHGARVVRQGAVRSGSDVLR